MTAPISSAQLNVSTRLEGAAISLDKAFTAISHPDLLRDGRLVLAPSARKHLSEIRQTLSDIDGLAASPVTTRITAGEPQDARARSMQAQNTLAYVTRDRFAILRGIVRLRKHAAALGPEFEVALKAATPRLRTAIGYVEDQAALVAHKAALAAEGATTSTRNR